MPSARPTQSLAALGILLALAAWTFPDSTVPSAAAARRRTNGALAPFGRPCSLEHGVRFCPTATLAQRVPSFDGVPLDVDVTLPASGRGPFPTIVMLHGAGQNKTAFEAGAPAGDDNGTYAYNNVYYARHGFAVVNYSARGSGSSCGALASRADPACAEGFGRLADQRYEARDTQFLLGELADEHIAEAGRLGVTGESYGGAQSVELAYLRNRIRLPDGSFARWRSPAGRPLEIDAAWARWPWSDLMEALWPNGRFLDGEVAPIGQSAQPIGVELEEWISGLTHFEMEVGTFMAPPALDPQDSLDGLSAIGETSLSNTAPVSELVTQLTTYHQGYGLPGKPAPLLLESGWTDSILPPAQSLRIYNAVRAQGGQVALQLGDLGHLPASNKANTNRAFNMQGARFFAARLRHVGNAPRNYSVSAFTLTCPTAEPGGGPYTARSWAALHPHRLDFGSPATQAFTSAGGDPELATALNPVGSGEACKTVPAESEPNSATYTTTSSGTTVLGMPTITATIRAHGPSGELAARLWDVMPGGQQRLVDRGVYRLTDDQQGFVAFQLHGDGYRFAPGDTVELELLGRDAPYYRPSEGAVSVEVSDLRISLPTN
jgi:fermentation-respiration switch protein FrsA (DUF1100 family)